METKLAKLKQMMADGDHRGALKLAASWGRLGKEKRDIERGWAAYSNPEMYRSMGYDDDYLINAGLKALRTKYDIPLTDPTKCTHRRTMDGGCPNCGDPCL